MSELQVIEQVLARTARRRRWQRAWRGFWAGLFLGVLLWLGTLGCYKVMPLPEGLLGVMGGVGVLVALGGFVVGGWRGASLLQTARWVDDREHFQERLSTALELARSERGGRWRDLVLADAAARAAAFDARRFLPWHLPPLARGVVVVLALAFGLGFVPEYRTQAHQQRQRDAEAIRESGRQLTELVRRELAARPPALDTSRQALEAVRELGQQMGKVNLTRQQALKDLSSATDRIKDQLRELGKDPAIRKLDQGMQTGPMGTASTAEALQKKIEELEQELGKHAAQADALERMKEDLDKIQAAAAAMSSADATAKAAMKAQMSEMLSDLAKEAEAMGLDLAGLDEAMKALAEGQIDQLLKDLDVAGLDLEKMAQLAKSMKDMKSQLMEMGKNLAEQLEKGQGLPALATLQRMIRQLEGRNLTDQQLRDILAEVDQAVKPGSEYGKLGDYLKQAARQMEGGSKPGAAASLAQAAEELKRLMNEAGDCQGMMAALDALRTAQMCVGNGMSWAQCKGAGCRPGFKPGGKPGRGVGTWGDDSLYLDPEDSGLWDNSGIERPDQDARGHTDRGEGALNAGLTPTKVKGQISPGGQMPSITLRGVSIKGQSRVDYEERVATAQSEAQSALNQDQVPRAYRGAVRDYFDDLK